MIIIIMYSNLSINCRRGKCHAMLSSVICVLGQYCFLDLTQDEQGSVSAVLLYWWEGNTSQFLAVHHQPFLHDLLSSPHGNFCVSWHSSAIAMPFGYMFGVCGYHYDPTTNQEVIL